ncbi:adhesion component transport transmembrane protein ABC transporter [Mycobacterium tuberculosis '98-R604 INH-RIF-EM']|nr:adhesion component transport transmembrane protein ABC transporter [Mycobacterium tuberculosis '98-R604 INH-RIF-EM']
MNDQAPVAYAPLWRTAWRRLRQRPFQYILLVLGIALGVAMIVAIDVSSNSAQRAFRSLCRGHHRKIYSPAGQWPRRGGPTALCRSAPTRVRFFRSGNRRLCVGPRTGKPSYAVHGHRPICGVSFSLAFMVQPKYRRVGWLFDSTQRCRVKPTSGTEVWLGCGRSHCSASERCAYHSNPGGIADTCR